MTEASHQGIRRELERLEAEEEHLKQELFHIGGVGSGGAIITGSIDIPRSVSSAPPITVTTGEVESILPKSGEEVFPPTGPVHPVVEILLEGRPLGPSMVVKEEYKPLSTLPIVNPPPFKKESFDANEMSGNVEGLEEGRIAPHPSPTLEGRGRRIFGEEQEGRKDEPEQEEGLSSLKIGVTTKAPLTEKASPAPPLLPSLSSTVTPSSTPIAQVKSTLRNVMLIYPPNMPVDAVIRCVDHAMRTVIHPVDHLTIIWAGGGGSQDVETQRYSMAEGTQKRQEVRVSSADFEEALRTFREKAPAINNLVLNTPINQQSFTAKIHDSEDIRWALENEFQYNVEGKSPYDLIVLPARPISTSLSIPSSNVSPESLEQFVLQRSPAPIVLIRLP